MEEDQRAVPSEPPIRTVEQFLDPAVLLAYIRRLGLALLSADETHLDYCFGTGEAIISSVRQTCATFAADRDPLVVFLLKDEVVHDEYVYRLDLKLTASNDTVSSLAVIKGALPLAIDVALEDQLQTISLPAAKRSIKENPYEVLHSMLHFAVRPYFEAISTSQESVEDAHELPDNGDAKASIIPNTRRKLAELEQSLLHLQQNVEVPELVLNIHPVIERALRQVEDPAAHVMDTSLIPEKYLSDHGFLNSLQSIVNSWIKSIQTVTRMSRDPRSGSASQEINFWLAMETSLAKIEEQLESPAVILTLNVLKHGKRYHATVSFLSDTGIKEATEMVSRYNQLMRDFPLNDLITATSLVNTQQAIELIFNHINKKLRISPYPVWRTLALLSAISVDLNTMLQSQLKSRSLVNLDFASFNTVVSQANSCFETWDDCVKEFTNIAREVTRKRGEKLIPIRITASHVKTKERLEYLFAFRTRHEELRRTLVKVLGDQNQKFILMTASSLSAQFADIDPVKEIDDAYALLKGMDALDTSQDGINSWNNAERTYNGRTIRVEQAIIAILRDRLATAKSSSEMFRVFSKFNALFVRQSIRGAIQEYQNRLIENVKTDISLLQERFRKQYVNSEAYEMSKLRDIPTVSGTIIWIRQIEHQLNTYLQRIEDVLGKGWQSYMEGQKLFAEIQTFRKKLDTSTVYETWISSITKKKITISGQLFTIYKSKTQPATFELSVNFDPQIVTMFKEVRNLQWLNYQVPHSIATVSKDAKRVYPFAVSLIDSVQTLSRTLTAVEGNGQIESLLLSSQNQVFQLLSKAIQLKWESLAHIYDLQAVSYDRHESRHVRLVHEFETAVTILQKRAEEAIKIFGFISKLLNSLRSCEYRKSAFTEILNSIQEHVDKLNLELYSNIPQFVDYVNKEIQEILLDRCKQTIDQWIAAFGEYSKANSLAVPLEMAIHELTLKYQVISLSPKLESTRVQWLVNLQENIGCASQLRRLDANRYDLRLEYGQRRQSRETDTSFFDDIPRLLNKDLVRAYDVIEKFLSEATQYLGKWFSFQALWDLEGSKVFKILGDDMNKWLVVLNDIRRARTTFDTNEVSKSFGMLRIDFRQVQARINAKYDAWQHDIITRFSESLGTKMKETCSEMESFRRDLERQVLDISSTEMIVKCINLVQNCTSRLESWEACVGLFRQGQTTLSRYRFQFPSNWLFIDQIDNEWASLREILWRKSLVIEQQNDVIKSKIQSEISRLTDRIDNLDEQWQMDRPVSGSLDPKFALSVLTKFETEGAAISNSADLLSMAANTLDIPFKVAPGLEAVLEEVRDFTAVWTALESLWAQLNELRDTAWAIVLPRKIRQKLEDFSQMTKSMPTRIRQYAAFQHVQSVLKSLNKSVPLITALRSEAICDRHWNSLFKMLAPNKQISLTALTLGDVWDLNLSLNESKIKDIVTVAEGELTLENFLRQMKEFWSSFSLELVNYRNVCRLIKNWDDIFQRCSENLNSLSAMKNSHYYKVFEEEAVAWEDKLNRIHALFDTWIDVQRQWVYLEAVFNDNSEIKNILPVESARFQNINSELFVILRKVYKSPLILDVINIPGIPQSIERLADLLNRVQTALGGYFEKERQNFARFYFIGDEDLLEIIGKSNDIVHVERHLSKMFAGIHSFVYDGENSVLTGVKSIEGETLEFSQPVSLIKTPNVVDWLKDVEEQAKVAVSDRLKEAHESFVSLVGQDFTPKKFMIWIQKYPSQTISLALQIYCTEQCETAIGNGEELRELHNRLVGLLEMLAEFVINDLSLINRKRCESLITELIHNRTLVQRLLDSQCRDSKSFSWLSIMRYYWYPENEPLKRLVVKQANVSFTYGFEYLGIPDRLVCTPLVDDCYLTMMQALDQKFGGSPFGPAGTVKALGHALGKYVLIFCCDESFDFPSIGRILSGICQVGAWGCFDEFNRLNEHSLSAVSSIIEAIEVGLRKADDSTARELELAGRNITLSGDTGIFITMNPEYAGRNSLPENLKRLFRSFSMAAPDKEVIAEVLLNSQGFVYADRLARMIVPFFDELSSKVSNQIHYDFGLRALKSVLAISGRLKRRRLEYSAKEDRSNLEDWEAGILLEALHESITPKLVSSDIPLMIEIEQCLFAGISYKSQDFDSLRELICQLATESGLVASQDWIEKALHLYRFQQMHHGIMLVGSSGVGKTSVYTVLLRALKKYEQIEASVYRIDAKVLSKESLYGKLDPTTREWTDGLLTATLRRIVDNLRGERQMRHWIVFDGDVDPEWIENLNSVLDDNKVLTLPNGERISLPDNVRLIFETDNLAYATPATVSRCGMIWFGDDVVSDRMLFSRQLFEFANCSFDEVEEDVMPTVACTVTMDSLLNEFTTFIGETIISLNLEEIVKKAQTYDHIMQWSPHRSVQTFISLMKAAYLKLRKSFYLHPELRSSVEVRKQYVVKTCILALVWSFAGDCSLQDRADFGHYLMLGPELVELIPEQCQSILDYDVSSSNGAWESWLGKVPVTELDSHAVTRSDVVVPTVDTLRHEALVYGLLVDHKPLILCGPPGSGKTMTLFGALRKASNLDVVGLNFAKGTTPQLLIKTLEQYCEYKKTVNGTELVPSKIGRWLVVFCDEINLPATDTYGTQKIVSLLRQMIEQQGFWKEDERIWIKISNIQFVGACNPPTDLGRSPLSSRFLRHCCVVFVDQPGEVSLNQIYLAFNTALLKAVPALRGYNRDLTNSMVEFYLEQQARYKARQHSHYIYSPRELTRWSRGIFEAIRPLEALSLDGLVRLWVHEALRLFHDRLVEESERSWTKELIHNVAAKHFGGADLKVALKEPILYSNWLSRHYQPVAKKELVDFLRARLRTFGEEEFDTSLVLFDDLLDHILRIDRVLRQPQGHLILIGVSSSGKVSYLLDINIFDQTNKTTLSRFVAWMNGFKVFRLKTSRHYTDTDFASDLRCLLKRAGCNGEKICFILDESNILESSFLERMNILLANGEVPGLFEGDEYSMLMTACREGAQKQGINLDSEEEHYEWFTNEIIRNLHVVFTMNPPRDGLSSHAAASPALFNRCVLNWMGNWSDMTLYQVAYHSTRNLNIDKSEFTIPATSKTSSEALTVPNSFRESILHAMVYVHRTACEIFAATAVPVSITPGNYLAFLRHFVSIFAEKQNELEDRQRHFNVGLNKLRETVLKVKELRSDLAEKKTRLDLKRNQAKEMLRQMVSDQNEAERKREASIQIQQALDIQERGIAERREIVMRDLAMAEPAVLEAQRSVSNIKKQHLTELRSMGNPPEAVKITLESVCVLLGHATNNWKNVQLYIRRDDFISSIVNFDNASQMSVQLRKRMETEFLSRPNYNFETVNRASKACGPLLQWVEAQVIYSSILEKVGPLRDEVRKLEDEARTTRAQVLAISEMIEELEKSIESYKDDYAALITETQEIKNEMISVEGKVERSLTLLDSLSTEKDRWVESIKKFRSETENLAGDCLLSSAYLSYCGYFDQKIRPYICQLWKIRLEELGISYHSQNAISDHLISPNERLNWHENDLPADELFVENMVMIRRADQYPLIIDPTGRIVRFLEKQHETTKKLTITSFLDKSFMKHFESALRFGNAILVQDAEHFDPVLGPVINREYTKTGGRTLIELGRQEIDFSKDFQLYLFTRDPSIVITPHISSRTTVVNFTITRNSLESQALNKVLLVAKPEIERKRRELIKLQGEFKVRLRTLESNLLTALNESEGSILDNDLVVETLEKIKIETRDVNEKMMENDRVMSTIDEVMSQYQPLAKHSGLIFSILERLHILNPFYQFSLSYFLRVFETVLESHEDGTEYAENERLIKRLYLEVYRRTSSALLGSHKALLALLLGALYVQEDEIDIEQVIRVGEKSEKMAEFKPGCFKEIVSHFGVTTNLTVDDALLTDDFGFEKLEQLVGQMFENSRKSFLNKVLLIKLVRPEQMSSYIEQLCVEVFGEHMAYADEPELGEIVQQIEATTPVALCSVNGVDPTFKVEVTAEKAGVKCEVVAMGSNEGQLTAERALSMASRSGTWLLLQNIHLSPDWLENLEKRLTGINLHSNFRLFFTINFSSRVPTTLLRMSRIISFDRPVGLKSNVKGAYRSFNESRIRASPLERPRLYFLLAWVHGIIMERLNFVPLGWSKLYDFNDADLESASFVIDKWVTSVSNNRSNIPPSSLPWDALRYLIARTVYGGKVDRQSDLKKLEELVGSVFSELSYRPDFQLVTNEQATRVSDEGTLEDFANWIDQMPDREPSIWLGLPSNSEEKMRVAEGMSKCQNKVGEPSGS